MKIIVLSFLFYVCFLTGAAAQSFTAETGYIYNGASNKEFFGAFEIHSGTLKKTDGLDIYAETGRKFQASIKKIEVDGQPVQSARAGQKVTIDFVTTEDATTGKDYLRKGYKVYPKGYTVTITKTNNITGQPDKFTASLSGKLYKGASFNNGWYKKGMKGYAYQLPFLQLSIVNNDTTDTRSFIIQLFNIKESPATYNSENSEVMFSGSENGKKEDSKLYGYVKGSRQVFTIEITKWQIAGDKLTISGKMTGELKEVIPTTKNPEILKLENGVFENIEVITYNKPASLKK